MMNKKSFNMIKEKEIVQNSAMDFLKEKEIVFNGFKSGIYSLPSNKSKEPEESGQSWSQGTYEKTIRLDTQSKILSEDLLFRPKRLTQGTGIKTTPAEVGSYYSRKYMLVRYLKVYYTRFA